MSDLLSHPVEVAVLVLVAVYRVMLWLDPRVRRWRAARDLAWASATDSFRRMHADELKNRQQEFGVNRKGE